MASSAAKIAAARQIAADLRHALAVSAVDQEQQLAARRNESGEHRLDHEGPASLQRHRDVRLLAIDQRDQPLAHAPINLYEMAIARAVIVQHRLLDRRRGGKGPRSEEPGIASRRRRRCVRSLRGCGHDSRAPQESRTIFEKYSTAAL
jgi:hypothetical protein